MKTLVAIISIVATFTTQAQTSKDSPKLRDALKPSSSSYIYKTAGTNKLELFVDTPEGHKADAKVPAIVLFHGGGFKSGSEKQFEQHAKYLAGRGMVAIRARYRLTTEKGIGITDCVEDAKSAMRWVRANAGKLGVDPDRLAAGGGSAGGYLSAATLLIDSVNAETDPPGVSAKPNAMVLFNPAFGRPNQEEGALSQYVKPEQKLPPMISFFGTEDSFLAVARKFQDACQKTGNRCDIITYEGEGHSFFNKAKYFQLTITETDKFLVGLGWLKKTS